jgi:hypothetical protein
MRTQAAAILLFALTGAASAQAPGEKPREMDKTVGDAVTQPLSDANLRRKEIPAALIAIRDEPYALNGIRTCNQIIAAVSEMDEALGVDFDRASPEDRQKTERRAAKVAGGVIGGLVPFRGIIREISGANKADEDFRAAIYAGAVRRGFLKGYGKARRCAPPGRPLTTQENARDAALMMASDAANRAKPQDDDNADRK